MALRCGMINYKDEFLQVISFLGVNKYKKKEWKCICRCGTPIVRTTSSIKNKQMRSCRNCPNNKYISHGLSSHPLYSVWKDMKYRCANPRVKAFRFYGEKGIKVCDEWSNDPRIFIEWSLKNKWIEGLVLDRIDTHKGYYPKNCQFISRKENGKKVHLDHPGYVKGQNNPNAKLDDDQVREIKKLLCEGIRQCDIARKFKTRPENINRISKNKRWSHITFP
jgi:hypothetical protein